MFWGFPVVGLGAVPPYESKTESEISRWFYLEKKTFLSLLKQAVMFNQGMSDSLGPAL